jgi:hypothetical protein
MDAGDDTVHVQQISGHEVISAFFNLGEAPPFGFNLGEAPPPGFNLGEGCRRLEVIAASGYF